jgi:hypothetical protein
LPRDCNRVAPTIEKEEPTMTKVRTWVGLDVHAAATASCVVDALSGELSVHRLAGKTSGVAAFCVGLPAPMSVAYEAGPTGFALARALDGAGVGCVVAAPGKIERAAQDRVKTDRRDAERLVRLLMIGGLHPVRVPSSEEEARTRHRLAGPPLLARAPHPPPRQTTRSARPPRHTRGRSLNQ